MYGREELKKIYISEIDYLYSVRYNHESHYYDAKEADSVMDAYEQRIKELEAKLKETDEVMDSCKGLIESASVMSKSAEDIIALRNWKPRTKPCGKPTLTATPTLHR